MTNSSEQKKPSSKERTKYGTLPPYISLEEAVTIVKVVSSLGGFDGSIDALSKVTGNSASSSSFQKKLAALRGFGLLTVTSDSYSINEIGRKIAQPTSGEEEANGVFQAFCNNETLRSAWESYKGKILPQVKYFANFLESNLSIPSKVKDSWPPYFIEAANFAGLLHERETGSYQVLLAPSVEKKAEVEEPQTNKDEGGQSTQDQGSSVKPNSATAQLGISDSASWGILTQRRLSGNRRAVIAVPDELTQEDIETLKVILKGIEAQLDGLKKYDVQ